MSAKHMQPSTLTPSTEKSPTPKRREGGGSLMIDLSGYQATIIKK
jgi:hypothetical protein